jgi:hypothetical protein
MAATPGSPRAPPSRFVVGGEDDDDEEEDEEDRKRPAHEASLPTQVAGSGVSVSSEDEDAPDDDDDDDDLLMQGDVSASVLGALLAHPPRPVPATGLPLQEAHTQLVREVEQVLRTYAAAAPTWPVLLREYLRAPAPLAALAVVAMSVAYFALAVSAAQPDSSNAAAPSPPPYQFRGTGALVTGALVAAILAWNAWLYGSERKVEYCELHDAARVICRDMERCDFTAALVRTLRAYVHAPMGVRLMRCGEGMRRRPMCHLHCHCRWCK